ncbi:MAG: IS66 family insertion sequence element accessory protein TnpA [Bryobacteraceae bacterium]
MTRKHAVTTVKKSQATIALAIAQQERSELPVKQFCETHGITEQTFYLWRKRLRKQPSARFALVETTALYRFGECCGTYHSVFGLHFSDMLTRFK